jgi:hypothetical protein
MLSVFQQPEDSKQLYFRLRSSFSLADCYICNDSGSISGVYAIFKNNVCYYVGQSGNVASRIATHFTGKYIECDEVRFFLPSEENFSDFYERDKPSQKEILLNNERHCISLFKPIENILVADHEDIDDTYLFSMLQLGEDNLPSFYILKNYDCITMIDEIDQVFCLDQRAIEVLDKRESIDAETINA